MITSDMLSILCCPTCFKGELRAEIQTEKNNHIEEGTLICSLCHISYPVRFGVPDLVPESMLTGDEWQVWKEHLDGLQARREQRLEKPDGLLQRVGKSSHVKESFAEFIGKTEGNVLDIGCGPGKFRFLLKSGNYYGLDPIVLADVEMFPFIHGIAEYIPFKDDTFSHVLVQSALDHFKNLDQFFKEVQRVLHPDGKLHILQQIHDVKGPITAVKVLTHEVKDWLEDKATKVKNSDTPKHLAEFTTSSLLKTTKNFFEIVSVREHRSKWYVPNKIFLSLAPKKSRELCAP